MMPKTDRMTLEQYAISLAKAAAERSEDPFHKVGAALIRHDKTVAALGYNGPPPGVEIDWSIRDVRRAYIVHAEANALRYVEPGEVMFMATTMMPCQNCILLAASYGIRMVVYAEELDRDVYPVAQIKLVADDIGLILEKAEA
jgi:dCMP deaminase